jgi:hypothetical protein
MAAADPSVNTDAVGAVLFQAVAEVAGAETALSVRVLVGPSAEMYTSQEFATVLDFTIINSGTTVKLCANVVALPVPV